MKVTDQALLDLIEADYRSNHMYWIERRLNKHFERWFRHKTNVEIDGLLAVSKLANFRLRYFPIIIKWNMNR